MADESPTPEDRARLRELAKQRVMDEASIQHVSTLQMQQVVMSIEATIDIAVELGWRP